MPPHDLEGLLTAVTQGFTSLKTQHSVNLAQAEFLIIGCRRRKVKGLLKVKIKIPSAYYRMTPPMTNNYLPIHARKVSSIFSRGVSYSRKELNKCLWEITELINDVLWAFI